MVVKMNKTVLLETPENISFGAKIKQIFVGDHTQPARRRLFNSLWAILMGFVVCGIIIAFTGNNPFIVFFTLFNDGISVFGNKFITVFIAYVISSLAVALCFKCGLFNIGISGQMMMGGFTTLLIFQGLSINGGTVAFALIMSIVAGALVALLAGFLKTYFNVNEVVSTIMLNWVIFFVIKFVVQSFPFNPDPALKDKWQFFLSDGDSLSYNLSIGYTMPAFFQPSDLNNSWFTNNWNWIIITIGVLLVAVFGVILSKTALGYKIKMTGLSQDAANYSGTNKNALVMGIMALSGALSGLAGFIWYVGQGGQIDISLQPLTAGFDAIAIALIVFNNPAGILVSSFIYGIINAGSLAIPPQFPGLPNEINEIIIGIIVYIAAIAIIFSKFNLGKWIKQFFILSAYQKYRSAKVNNWKARIDFWKSGFAVRSKIRKIKSANIQTWKQIEEEYKHNIRALEADLWVSYQDKGPKFNIELLNENDQNLYFDKIASLRKERDINLAKNEYFDKFNIKSARLEKFKQEKLVYIGIRDEILENHKKVKAAQKSLKFLAKNELDPHRIEEILVNSWNQIQSIKLEHETFNKNKFIAIQNQLKDASSTYHISNPVFNNFKNIQEGGNN